MSNDTQFIEPYNVDHELAKVAKRHGDKQYDRGLLEGIQMMEMILSVTTPLAKWVRRQLANDVAAMRAKLTEGSGDE